MKSFMENYLQLWVKFFKGLLSLLMAIITPLLWLVLEILPYGITCLISGNRLKKEYKFLYFLPRFIKELTKLLRKQDLLEN